MESQDMTQAEEPLHNQQHAEEANIATISEIQVETTEV